MWWEESHGRMRHSGKSTLNHKILQESEEDLQYFNRISKEQGFTDIISDTITEFKKYNVTPSVLREGITKVDDEELQSKLTDLANIFEN